MNIKKIIKKVCDFLQIKEPIIEYNAINSCFYNNGIIHLNKKLENNKLIYLAIHELRHYYQDLYIKNNNDNLSEKWKYEMDNYNTDMYLDYDIEIDAYSFAYLALKYLFNIKYKLHPTIEEIVFKYIKLHKDDLYKNLIIEEKNHGL
jgi:hypothetical protein